MAEDLVEWFLWEVCPKLRQTTGIGNALSSWERIPSADVEPGI